MENLFKDWKIDGYTAKSPDGKYELWVGNGFWFFDDHNPNFPKETLLKGISFISRYKIWKQLCEERNNRAKNFLSMIK